MPDRPLIPCLSLDQALKKLEAKDPDSFRLVMLRYFGVPSVEEAAEALEISPWTAKRYGVSPANGESVGNRH